MKATEGNGGPPIIISREPIERPEIPRGLHLIDPQDVVGQTVDGRLTFKIRSPLNPSIVLTYWHVPIKGDGREEFIGILIGPDVVVTWERIEPAGAANA